MVEAHLGLVEQSISQRGGSVDLWDGRTRNIPCNQPSGKRTKAFEICISVNFRLFHGARPAANATQRGIDGKKQDALKQQLANAQSSFSNDLGEIKGTEHSILSYVINPPKGVTVAQLAEYAKRFEANTPPTPSPAAQVSPASQNQPVFLPYQISSAPKMLANGAIKGSNFGSTPGTVHIHARVLPTKQVGNYAPSQFANSLLGTMLPSNDITIDSKYVRWNDTNIELNLPGDYEKNLMDQIMELAKRRGMPLSPSDVEFGYSLMRAHDPVASPDYFYP
jgi:hypothetical protein